MASSHLLRPHYRQAPQLPLRPALQIPRRSLTGQVTRTVLQQLDILLEQTLDNETVVYFADGVHPTHNTRSTHAWIEKGTATLQPTLSGRDRVNINAVINAKDPIEVIGM